MEEHTICHPEIKGLLERLDERSLNMSERADDILDQLKKLNSKVAHHETEIHKIKVELAVAQGVWSGVNKTLTIGLTLIGIIAGAIATMLWH
jgi:chromosome segregation ATPase